MAKYLRYMGEFLSRAGIVWRVEILQDADAPFDKIGSLTFEADSPLVMEWNCAKEETVCGSTATLRVESPGDRTYEDLYTIAPGRIRMDVYRSGALYWSGALDPEFYEEPYERLDKYPVTLTFSDFGILDRQRYDLSGMRRVGEIIRYALEKSGIRHSGLDHSLTSTYFSDGKTKAGIDGISVRSDNFYDEDGEALSLKDVVEGVLCPLGLHMVQRAGHIYIYDFNALYLDAPMKSVEWDGDSQILSTDKVYNNVKVTWSAYAQGTSIGSGDCWNEDIDTSLSALNNEYGLPTDSGTLFSYHSSNGFDEMADTDDIGFNLWVSDNGDNSKIIDKDAEYFKIVPKYSGNEAEGVALRWPGIRIAPDKSVVWKEHGLQFGVLAGTTSKVGGVIFKSHPVQIPHIDNPDSIQVRLTLEMLMDYRINPFEEAENMGDIKQKDWEENWNRRGNFLYVPVTVKFRPEGSSDIYCWDNRSVVTHDMDTMKIAHLGWSRGQWVKEASAGIPSVWGYLCYYDTEDRAEKSAVGGWKRNRTAINPHSGKLSVAMQKADDGQYLPYPNAGKFGGELWVEVRESGWMISDGDTALSSTSIINTRSLWQKFCWLLCKLPEVEMVNNNLYDRTISTDDVEYNGVINPDAKEDLEIDTICGSCAGGIPTARGAYYSADTGEQITSLTRAGHTTQIENLLIGTMFSQFADRRTTLSGEMRIVYGGAVTCSERNQGDKKFIITSDVQDVIADTSDATITELRPDEYRNND